MTSYEKTSPTDVSHLSRTNINPYIRGATLLHSLSRATLRSTHILPTSDARLASVHFLTALGSPYYAGTFVELTP